MKISIAMATYNGAKYLPEQLQSFIDQSRQADELVVCDDNSSDTTLEILEAYSQKIPFTVVIHSNKKTLGYIKNFEKALSLCSGDIIFLSDQDDFWFPEKISTMVGFLNKEQDVFVLQTDMMLTNEDLVTSNCTQLGNILSLGLSPDTFLTGCGMAIRKKWLNLALPIPSEATAHDNWIHRLAMALGVRALHDAPLQYYRRHDSNTSQWLTSKSEGVSRFNVLRLYWLKDPSIGWQRELERSKATLLRLEEGAEVLRALGLFDRRSLAIFELTRKIWFLSERIRHLSLPRYRRFRHVLIFWVHGGYSYFSGWKSAAKDFLRPRASLKLK